MFGKEKLLKLPSLAQSEEKESGERYTLPIVRRGGDDIDDSGSGEGGNDDDDDRDGRH